MPRVLIFSTTTGYQLRSFGEAAASLGIDLAFATDRCHAIDDPWRDGAIAVRFHEEEASLDAIRAAAVERPIDGVLAVGDRPVVLAARAAQALGLPGNDPGGALASTHKRLARERLAQAGLFVPWFARVRIAGSGDEAMKVAASLPYPAVLKPVGLSGSRGVIRADDPPAFVTAHRRIAALLARPEVRALRTGHDDELIVEGFIPGREYAIEGVLTAGRLHVFAIFDKPDPLDGPYFEETIYATPSLATAAEQDAIAGAVGRAAAALGLSHGPVHAECRVNEAGVYVLEVAARPIGGLCSRVLRFADERGGDRSLEHVLLTHAIGGPADAVRREPRAAAVMMVPIPRRGILKRVDGVDEARQVAGVEDVVITAKVDQLLEPLPEAAGYLGFVFARADTAEGATAAVREAHARLVFAIHPAIAVVGG